MIAGRGRLDWCSVFTKSVLEGSEEVVSFKVPKEAFIMIFWNNLPRTLDIAIGW